MSSNPSYCNNDVNLSFVHKFHTVILRIHKIHKTKMIKTVSKILVFG